MQPPSIEPNLLGDYAAVLGRGGVVVVVGGGGGSAEYYSAKWYEKAQKISFRQGESVQCVIVNYRSIRLDPLVLAPFLFALYTADCRSTDESCPVVKFADDTE